MSCCNQCNSSPCCCTTIIRNPVVVVGPPGPQGPVGPQGNSGQQGPKGDPGECPCPIKVVNFATNANFQSSPYVVDGSEDVILVDMTVSQDPGSAGIFLLPASDPAVIRTLTIKDAFGLISATKDIVILPDGTDTIDIVNAPLSLFATVGTFGSVTLVSNGTNGYSII